ncbi:putative major facilitator superfamily transporter protein [Phaeoacremonium minimum UCRPA7]|uniref:Putative major facilitator superfamily transporter protein n=1 Tax=Phaeoacremonium minimum (strain UCR-PA7) TaxID=1286976 RepID=R8BHH4_PHAM7|nr:putative major facilitator superfamily transporter protein [Phaeoacremonium minimum UCRPA7]EON98795.1 putative major facilitator superfamily transporter protein [Phaeoacremonium minimum UCRPA7]
MERATQNSFFSDSEKPDYSDREFGQDPDTEKDIERGPAPRSPASSRAASETADATPEPATTDATAPAKAPGSGIPDGGWDAWLQVIGSWVILVDTWGLINTFGVFQTYYETELLPDTPSSSISWIGSLQGSLLMLVGVISGPLYDAGYFRHLVAGGLFLIVLGQFMTSLCKTYWQLLLAQGICIGVGMGLSFLPSAAILAQYFHKRRALVLGLSSSGSPLAGIVFPIIFSRLQPRIGFGWATRVIAFILLGISVIPVVFMKTRIPANKGKKRSFIDTSALRDVPYMLFVVGCFFGFLVLYVAFFYTQLFDVTHHLSSLDFAPYTVTMLNVGSVFGRVLPNYFADKVGSLNVLIVCASTSAVLLFGWMGIHNLGGLIVFALLYGLFSGGLVSVTPSVVMGLTPDLSKMGARMGVTFLASGISILVGTPIAGAIVGDFSRERWLGVMGYAAAGLILGASFYVAARILLYKKKGGWRA